MVFAAETSVDLGLLGSGRISRLLGQGGQGHVYEVLRPHGPPLALKWYKPHCATEEQYRTIQALVDFGAPHTRFLWPLSLARIDAEPGFGYVMALRDPRFLDLNYLLAAKTPQGEALDVSFAAVLALARQLSFSFLRLHAAGLCYRDISFGNVFFEPFSGDILICDNDNVGVDNGTGRVLGTPFFMAPEIVRDTGYATLPNSDTDRHSLAVLLFYVLCVGHPFEGRRNASGLRDADWLVQHLGVDPVFCMHPARLDNRPSELVEAYWNLYPPHLRDLFVQAFVDGATDPSQRVTESQWVKALDRLRDGLMSCPSCGETAFWDAADDGRPCGACGRTLVPDYLVDVGRRSLVSSAQASIRVDHLRPGADDPRPVGRFVQHLQEPHRWALHNVSREPWSVRLPDGGELRVDDEETIELGPGLDLRVGSVVASVRRPGVR